MMKVIILLPLFVSKQVGSTNGGEIVHFHDKTSRDSCQIDAHKPTQFRIIETPRIYHKSSRLEEVQTMSTRAD